MTYGFTTVVRLPRGHELTGACTQYLELATMHFRRMPHGKTPTHDSIFADLHDGLIVPSIISPAIDRVRCPHRGDGRRCPPPRETVDVVAVSIQRIGHVGRRLYQFEGTLRVDRCETVQPYIHEDRSTVSKGRHHVCLSDADVDRPRDYEDMIGVMTGSLVVRPDAQRRIWLHVPSTS